MRARLRAARTGAKRIVQVKLQQADSTDKVG